MLRPDRIIVRVASVQTKIDFIRTKVVKSSSILNPAEKIKLYHKENKELFGPLLDRKKPKKTRLQKSSEYSVFQLGQPCNKTHFSFYKSSS